LIDRLVKNFKVKEFKKLFFAGLVVSTAITFLSPRSVEAGPVVLVFDVEGSVDPELFPFQELSAGSTITLSEDAVLNFMHYKTCETLTVKGGTIQIGLSKIKLEKGLILDKAKKNCVDRVVLKNDTTEIGSIKLRAAPKKMRRIGTSPTFVTSASGWPLGSEVALFSTDGELVTKLRLAGKTATLPPGMPLLHPGEQYILKIIMNKINISEIKFKCSQSKTSFTILSM